MTNNPYKKAVVSFLIISLMLPGFCIISARLIGALFQFGFYGYVAFVAVLIAWAVTLLWPRIKAQLGQLSDSVPGRAAVIGMVLVLGAVAYVIGDWLNTYTSYAILYHLTNGNYPVFIIGLVMEALALISLWRWVKKPARHAT